MLDRLLRKKTLLVGIACTLVAIATALLIYLTPLKHVNLVEPSIRDLTPTEFYEMYKGNETDYVFIDVRPDYLYDELHAEGSINIPINMLYDERHDLPKKGKQIVLICGGNRLSGVSYGYLEHYGFQNLYRVYGGMPAWHLAGLPVVSNF